MRSADTRTHGAHAANLDTAQQAAKDSDSRWAKRIGAGGGGGHGHGALNGDNTADTMSYVPPQYTPYVYTMHNVRALDTHFQHVLTFLAGHPPAGS